MSTKETNNGGNSDGDPPLPIPNREVKPVSADGTAIPSGRVGSRQLSETFRRNSGGLFFMYKFYLKNSSIVLSGTSLRTIFLLESRR